MALLFCLPLAERREQERPLGNGGVRDECQGFVWVPSYNITTTRTWSFSNSGLATGAKASEHRCDQAEVGPCPSTRSGPWMRPSMARRYHPPWQSLLWNLVSHLLLPLKAEAVFITNTDGLPGTLSGHVSALISSGFLCQWSVTTSSLMQDTEPGPGALECQSWERLRPTSTSLDTSLG